MKRYILLLFSLAISLSMYAQQRLTLDDAIAKALEHNFDIRVAKVSVDQAKENNTAGNAGMLPSVYGSGSLNGGSNNIFSQLAAGGTQEKKDARSSSYAGAVNASWTLFDGTKMFVVKKQLDEQEKYADLALKAQVQATVSQVIQTYAQVVYQQQQSVAIDTGLMLASVRMSLSLAKFETGASPKTDYLQARVDYNARQSDSMYQVSAMNIAFGNLNVLLGENADATWIVDDTLISDLKLEPADKELLKDANFGLAAARTYVDISKLNAKIQKTYMYPSLVANGSYNYSRSTSQTGFALFTRNYGPSGSLNLNVPVFQGGNLRRQYKVASLQAFRDELTYEKQETDFGRQYRTAWNNYQLAVVAYHLESENIKYAKENLFIQQERFRVGVATTLEARQAENDYITALVRLYTTAYNLKQAETNVLALENALVK